ncbi:LpxI family protein [Pseudodonghicola flavimaris]|uniref:UDP-2,3-diacylglucosamine diphosphatase LpxI n=1 Tax=Pseudodonghicola flavimaris TaxID=3050036 RepID=A0ABT7F700_9RHOB|nr:UDP-2,3-diacylglucosamine diphosphatase LpxI [Pseudodonghicola flavimaris]MDK3020376.1 UDP-2,3-diacylglucosamine diphosphatase LpxI [Pseudodonghicola flavimaris]
MLALIAGRGALPVAIARAQAEPALICALEDNGPDRLDVDLWFRIETLGSLIADLKERGVTGVCMAGGIRRPAVDPAALDAATLPFVPVLTSALQAGDDGALRAVIGIFESAGFTVLPAQEAAPGLLIGPGCPTAAQPAEPHRRDAIRGAEIVAAMGAADIGQACAVLNGQALAVEGAFGTDWMLSTLFDRPDDGGGILFKAPKPDQDRRADLPAIGPDTVRGAADAGLEGIVIEAEGVILLDPEAVVATCDRMGLFLWSRERAG